jgi:hypothetical protein
MVNNAVRVLWVTSHSDAQIDNSKIHDTGQAGISLTNSNAWIYDNEITRCSPNTLNGAIHISNQSTDGIRTVNIWDNHIHNNFKQGITAWDITGGARINPVINRNIIEYNLTGIYLIHCGGRIEANIIRNNFIQGDANSGAGIMLTEASTNTIVQRNLITGNYTGFFIGNNAAPRLGVVETNIFGDNCGHNMILNNIDMSGTNHSIFMFNTTQTINAKNNIFNSTDPATIASTITTGSGSVLFEPFLEKGVVTGSFYDREGGVIFYGDSGSREDHYPILVYDIENETFRDIFLASILFFRGDHFVSFLDPGLYILYAETTEFSLKDVYGGIDEPNLIRVNAGELISNIDFQIENNRLRVNDIKHGETFTHASKQIVPITFYRFYELYRSDVLYLYDEGDFIWQYGERKLNVEASEWTDLWFDEPISFLKVRNVELYDEWNSHLGRNIVRNISETVHIDILDENDDNKKRWFLQTDRGIIQRNDYDARDFHRGVYNHQFTLTQAPVSENPQSLFPLHANAIYQYETNYDTPWINPHNLQIYSDGYIFWEPGVGLSNSYDEFRIYKNNTIFATTYIKRLYLDVDPSDLVGSWHVTAYTSRFGGYETPPSNVVHWGVNESEIVRPITNLAIASFPNPVRLNSSSNISFDITSPQHEQLTLEIFNIKGQKVTAINIDSLDTKTSVTLNLSSPEIGSLSSGIYLYRLKSEKESVVNKFLLLQ